MTSRYRFVLFFALFGLALPGWSIPLSEEADSLGLPALQARLAGAGFIDIALRQSGDTLQLLYSRSCYRSGAPATQALLALLPAPLPEGIGVVEVTVTDRNIPQYAYHMDVRAGRLDTAAVRWQIGRPGTGLSGLLAGSARASNYTAVLSLEPQLRIAFGANPDPVQVQFNLLPTLGLQLWRGSLLQVQAIVPVYNELDIPEERRVRPGLLSLHQLLRPAPGLFVQASLGYFPDYRYGGHLQAGQFLWGDRIYLGVSGGYTGYAAWPRRLSAAVPEPGWEASPLNYADYLLEVGWRWHRMAVQVMAGHGRALQQQRLSSLSVERQFRQLALGFFAQRLDGKYNYGLQMQLPIPFFRAFAGRRWTFQTGPFVDFRYNGTQHYPHTWYSGQPSPFLGRGRHPGMIIDMF